MNMTPDEDARWHSHPMVSRYDKRSGNGQLEQERQRERELRVIRRRIRRLIEKLETAPDDNIQAKRLYFEILDRERDRLEGKPHTAEPPRKTTPTESGKQLRDAIENLFHPKPSPSQVPTPA